MDDFLDYYDRELDFIRRTAGEFAEKHQKVAGGLLVSQDGRCADPHVERLLEGFAFLAARVRKKIDDEYPEITDAFLSVVYPHYQRPIPSMAVVQFTPAADPTKVAAGHVIARETEIVSRPVKADPTRDDSLAPVAPCKFRTAYPTTLWPVSVESASLARDRVVVADKPPGATSLLRLSLRCTAQGGWGSLERFGSLRFFLDGHEPVPTSIYESLFTQLCGVWLQGTKVGKTETVVLPDDAVRPVGFGPDEGMFPYPERSFPGYRLLQEFLAFPTKFLFFDLVYLDRIARAGLSGTVEVLFFLKQPPRTEVTIRADNFKLGCAPVVNLFREPCDPIPLNQLQTEYPVVPRRGLPYAYEVYSVDRVVSVGSYLDSSYEFEPFYATRHAERGAKREAYWFATRKPSLREKDEGTEVSLAFTDPHFNPTRPAVETVTVHATCTNRDLPRLLPFGGADSDLQLESDAPVSRVRLLTEPTRPLRPPLGRSAQWKLISQLGLNHLSLIESSDGPEALRTLLSLYDFSAQGSNGPGATAKMIQGVTGVTARRIAGRTGNRLGNTLSLGVEIKVEFDEEAYAGSGAFLLASVLDRFFGAYVTINSFTQMVAVSKQREGVLKRWPPRCGDRTLL
jgi:type VI secretion system protein ImpG